MKNIFLTFAVTVISSFALLNNASAQNELGINEEDLQIDLRPLVINIPADSTEDYNLKDVNEKAVKKFEKEFPHANQPSWYKAEDGYIASFKTDDVLTKVSYDEKGRYLHTIHYYGEKMLPKDVRQIIKSVYYDYSITSVVEIHSNETYGETTYVVTIEDASSMKILQISNFEILSIKDYKKG